MSGAEESPAQLAARLRRERREAKIRAGGSARLDKITSLSGRTPASLRDEPPRSVSPFSNSTPELQPEEASRSISPLPKFSSATDQSPEDFEAQQAYLRALLRSKQPLDQPQEPDPTAKLLSTLMGLDSASPDAVAGNGASGLAPADLLSRNLTSSFSLPPSIANFFTQQLQPESPDSQQRNRLWRILHTIVAFTCGIWLILMLRTASMTYGENPPPPATVQSPFVHFVTAELVLGSARLLTSMRNGQLRTVRPWMQILSDIARDGKIILFLLGIAGMWMRTSDMLEEKLMNL
ncbi:hypothetical protein CPC735_049380 [Coccidioides posadasii C735 delta SOWgp]|uniref:GET complex, subunit GET2 n=1 Tax=Coccidioides posadasii (strain C735) TaxID=222929 RepID=C5PGB5_COCP7|nr:hypothetical protein CPC735_049380 [Coccidioides posadasii C735 delta SOWgp]EER23568.1 hypothetical protein CPC735_049380 [Coccidioides posadasii C735 delta SOWgp]|eukprot:XP_003065713.1 hypothetical protein CPC735_049380 [Coccidioides posadasii C735 delta SOWgp]